MKTRPRDEVLLFEASSVGKALEQAEVAGVDAPLAEKGVHVFEVKKSSKKSFKGSQKLVWEKAT